MSPRPDVDVVSSDAIVDVPVVNSAGDEVGRIAYLMLDVDQGRVAYAVLAHGGALGLAEQLFEVPWRSLRRDAAKERFVLLPIDGVPTA
jgi:sporulation protein YlmC with PRC-barrel domain